MNREQPHSPLPCHHVISVASIGVASTPGRENARDSFCGRLSVWNRTTPDRRHLLPVATTKLIMRCVQKLNFQMYTALSNENGKFYTTMIYPCFSRSVCFSMGSPAWWRFGLCSSGSSLVCRWHDACTREFQMWRRRCKQIDPRWFQGRQLRFWWMLIW